MKTLFTILLLGILCGCASRAPTDNSSTITSMQLIDRNGFAETISNRDRLKTYKEVDFLGAQPYQKVLRVYGRNDLGQSTAKITSYHDNGQLWQYLEVVDGRAHGIYREWFANGHLKIEATVIEGLADISDLAQSGWVFDGLSRVWDETGNQIASIPYAKGVLDEPSLYYHPNGRLHKIIPYAKGAIDGDVLIYDEEGQMLEKIPHVKGVKHGLTECYWANLLPLSIEQFEDGLLSQGAYYDRQGALVSTIDDGTGKLSMFDGDCLLSTVTYHHGVPQGLVTFFRPDGTVRSTYQTHNGKKEGEEWEYYPPQGAEKPVPKLCVHWRDDLIQGMIKTWYPNGVMESQREINGNKKQGLSFGWYNSGDLMLLEEYENDRLVKGSYFRKGDKSPISRVEGGNGTATLHTSAGIFLRKITYEKGSPKIEE